MSIAKLNVQGLSRRDEGLMRCIVATPGYTLVSSDSRAAEPSVTAHYSKDPNYRLATFDMIGKTPYFRKDGLLIIDDIYLMVASRYPEWEPDIKEAFSTTYGGVSAGDKWVEDPDFIAKGVLKHIRPKAKSLGLGIAYGLGPTNMVLFAAQNGFDFPKSSAKEFYNLYWNTYPRVRSLGKKLEKLYEAQGYIQNDFGYCLYPSRSYKCLNYLIQSSVTGLMHLFKMIFFKNCPFAHFVTVIHDEILFEVPTERLVEARMLFDKSVEELNNTIQWSVIMRFGWVEGKDWYEAK